MNDINKLFFELIRIAIGNQACLSHTPRSGEWGELYAMAKKQSLVGICFAGVQKTLSSSPFHSINSGQVPGEDLNMPQQLYLLWMGMAAKIQQRNEVVNWQCVELQEKLDKAEIKSSILKGQGIAALYSENLRKLRQTGDIDVYVDCGRENAIEYARSIQDEVDWDYKHLHLKVFPDTEVEVHYRPEVLMNLRKNARLQRWFEEPEVQSSMFLVSNGLVAPSVEFNLVYILLHIYRHFLFEGVGLRQLMDYYFVLRTQIGDSSHSTSSGQAGSGQVPILGINDDLLRLLREFGMERFAKGVMWIMLYVFEGKDSINHKPYTLNLQIEPDEKEGKYILREVMEGGNFGHHDERLSTRIGGKKGSVVKILRHNWHLLAHYPSEALWAPIYFVWHYFWKKMRD